MPNNTVKLFIRVDKVHGRRRRVHLQRADRVVHVQLQPVAGQTQHGRASELENQPVRRRDGHLPAGRDRLPAEPAFTLEKLQRNAAGIDPFTTATLPGEVGEEVEYEVIAKNTGNVPLKFSNFVDPGCDEGTLAGGPGESSVAAGAATTYTCRHTLTEADDEAGSSATPRRDTGTPPAGEPVTHSSNAVLIEPIT